jgi:hypothetical protein
MNVPCSSGSQKWNKQTCNARATRFKTKFKISRLVKTYITIFWDYQIFQFNGLIWVLIEFWVFTAVTLQSFYFLECDFVNW